MTALDPEMAIQVLDNIKESDPRYITDPELLENRRNEIAQLMTPLLNADVLPIPEQSMIEIRQRINMLARDLTYSGKLSK